MIIKTLLAECSSPGEAKQRVCILSKVGYILSSPKYTGKMTDDATYSDIPTPPESQC